MAKNLDCLRFSAKQRDAVVARVARGATLGDAAVAEGVHPIVTESWFRHGATGSEPHATFRAEIITAREQRDADVLARVRTKTAANRADPSWLARHGFAAKTSG